MRRKTTAERQRSDDDAFAVHTGKEAREFKKEKRMMKKKDSATAKRLPTHPPSVQRTMRDASIGERSKKRASVRPSLSSSTSVLK